MNKNRTHYPKIAVCVRTINGKTISIECDIQQKAARILQTAERKTSISRGAMHLASQGKVLNDKKTIEENSVEAGTTIEMSLRIIGGIEKEEQMETTETQENRKKRKLMEMCESKPSRPSDDAMFLRKEKSILEENGAKDGQFSSINREPSRNPPS